MNTSGVIQLNKTAQVIIIGIVVSVIIWFKMSSSGTSNVELEEASVSKDTDIVVKEVKDLKVNIDGKTFTVAYRETSVDKPIMDILFLHGQAFKSLTWVTKPMWTLQHFGKLGYRSVAIDLPGFGDSPKPDTSPDPAAFLEAVIQELKLNAPVIVSPSMSGSYSLPYLFKDSENVLSRCRGYIPVAPVHTSKYTPEQYASLKVPALVIYGENDKSLGQESLRNLKNLPQKTIVELQGSGHPCYLDRPDDFHSHMQAFLEKIR